MEICLFKSTVIFLTGLICLEFQFLAIAICFPVSIPSHLLQYCCLKELLVSSASLSELGLESCTVWWIIMQLWWVPLQFSQHRNYYQSLLWIGLDHSVSLHPGVSGVLKSCSKPILTLELCLQSCCVFHSSFKVSPGGRVVGVSSLADSRIKTCTSSTVFWFSLILLPLTQHSRRFA